MPIQNTVVGMGKATFFPNTHSHHLPSLPHKDYTNITKDVHSKCFITKIQL